MHFTEFKDTMIKQLPKYAFYNGNTIPFDQARIHVLSPAVHYATGVFEGIRGYWNQEQQQMYVFRLDDHLKRLEHSQKILAFDDIIEAQQATQDILNLIRVNKHYETIHVRPCVFIEGHGTITSTGPVGYAITTAISTASPARNPNMVNQGCTAQVSSWIRMSENSTPVRVKAFSNYMNSRMAEMQAVHDGYDTAILARNDGTIAEGARMCIFIVKDGQLITPSLTSDILESITRQTVFQICQDQGLTYVERHVNRSELYTADEAFFCGSGWEITPINRVDHVMINTGCPGAVTRKLQNIYFDIVHGRDQKYKHWLTPVY
jgi:branched-chain amino acid aminotransferase